MSVIWGGGDISSLPLVMSNNLSVKSHTFKVVAENKQPPIYFFHIVIFFWILLEVVFLW
jgi:hypothetical protein